MNYKSDFEGAAKSLTSRYAELSRKAEEALSLSKKGQHEEANAVMLDLIRKSEKATILSRKLPAHTGNPNAAAEVDAVLGEACPIKMGFIQRGWFFLRMPPLARCKDAADKEYIRGMLYPALLRFWIGKPVVRFPESVIVLRHVYTLEEYENRKRDYDNVETKFVIDAVAMYLLEDDSPDQCEVFHCAAMGQESSLDVYVIPQDYFSYWYNGYKDDIDSDRALRDEVPWRWRD